MQKLTPLIVLLIITLTAGGCQQSEDIQSGFLSGVHGATPLQSEYSGTRPDIQISNLNQVPVVVYTHGNYRPQRKEDCNRWSNQIPPALQSLHDEHILLYYHCSAVVDHPLLPGSTGNWIFNRADEMAKIIDELNATGVVAENIFLAGHSAGGWSALMAAREFGDRFNGVIAFGPAFAGPRSEDERYPVWRQEIRPRQIEYMLEAGHIRALIFAYEDDPFNRPQDLDFLTDAYPNSLDLIGYNCDAGHVTHIRDCREEETTEAILQFIGSNVASE